MILTRTILHILVLAFIAYSSAGHLRGNGNGESFSLVVLAPQKSGGQFLHAYFKQLAALTDASFHSEIDYGDSNPIEAISAYQQDESPRKILAPHRFNNFSILKDHADVIIYLYRNPIDMLISRYFAYGWSIAEPEPSSSAGKDAYIYFTNQRASIRNMSIDDYVLRNIKLETEVLQRAERFLTLMARRGARILVSNAHEVNGHFGDWHDKVLERLHVPPEAVDALKSQWLHDLTQVQADVEDSSFGIEDLKVPLDQRSMLESHVLDYRVVQYRSILRAPTVTICEFLIEKATRSVKNPFHDIQ